MLVVSNAKVRKKLFEKHLVEKNKNFNWRSSEVLKNGNNSPDRSVYPFYFELFFSLK